MRIHETKKQLKLISENESGNAILTRAGRARFANRLADT